MTESRCELPSLRCAALLAALIVTACHPGLAPEAPDNDAANPQAAVPNYVGEPNPYETSAFTGAKVKKGGGHDHHMHNHDGHSGKPTAKPGANDEAKDPEMPMPMDHDMKKGPK